MKSVRLERLDSEFQKLIYNGLKYDLNIVGITEMFSVTGVDSAPDLKTAKVYISVYSTDKEKKQKTFSAIASASAQIRRYVASKMHIKYVPEFTFLSDDALEYGNKIDKILSTLTYSDNNEDN